MAGLRRVIVLVLAGALLVGVATVDQGGVATAASPKDPPRPSTETPAPIPFEPPETRSAPGVESVAATEPTFVLPEPGVQEILINPTMTAAERAPLSLGAPRNGIPVSDATDPVETAESPVEDPNPATSTTSTSSSTSSTSTTTRVVDDPDVGTRTPTIRSDASVRLEVLGQKDVERLGADALAFRAQRADRGRGALQVGMQIDYGSIRGAFDGGWPSRLRLVEIPACSLTTPNEPSCWVERVVPTHNDLDTQALVVDATEVADPKSPAGGGFPSILMLSAGTSGPEGDYSATPLSRTGQWNVGMNAGDFTWSYDVPLPPAIAGPSPDLSIDYSSQAVDGMTSFSNSQPGWTGLGWSLPDAFIERSYRSCTADGGSAQDLCWYTNGLGVRDHLVLSMNGKSSRLVTDGWSWRAIDNPAWHIMHGTGAPNGDDDGEWWEITTEDGTRYRFGLSRNDATGADMQSTWWVPVVGNHPGEPGFPGGQTNQAWRWNLDKVTDPNGNTMLIYRQAERNHYGALGAPYAPREYVRGGYVTHIDYGLRENGQAAAPPARVTFNSESRCWTLAGCPEPSKNSPGFLDVPVDLLCSPDHVPCAKDAPTFFTSRFLRSIETSVLTAFGYGTVDRIDLAFTYPDNGEGSYRLFLRALQRTGYTGGTAVVMPATRFDSFGSLLQNRTYPNPSVGVPAMKMFRVDSIRDELGGAIEVFYTQPDPCPWPAKEAGWDTNTFDCYPQWGNPGNGGTAGWAAYNKWLVGVVTEVDRTNTDSPLVQTNYDYVGAPAWHHDDDPIGSPSTQSWSEWRGYDTVLEHQGLSLYPHTQSHTEHRFFRGMFEDPLVGGASKADTVAYRDGSGRVPDYDWLAGLPLEQTSLTFSQGDWISDQRHGYSWSNPGAGRFSARWTRPASTTHLEKASQSWGGVRQRGERFSYDGNGQLAATRNDGDVLDPADDRCTITPRLQGPTGIVDRPWLEELWVRDGAKSGDVCFGGGGGAAAKRTEYFYDGGGPGAAPVWGNVTTTRSFDGRGQFFDTRSSNDQYGRGTSSTDPMGRTTVTSYQPADGRSPDTTTVTNVKGHRTTTTNDVGRGTAVLTSDPNGHLTVQRYDGVGRLTDVWQPSESAGQSTPSLPPSYRFSYGLDVTPWGDSKAQTKVAPVVCSQRLIYSLPDIYVPSCSVSDGLGRERQSMTRAADSTGSAADELLVSSTNYDFRGLVSSKTTVPHRVSPAPPLPGFMSVTGATPGETRTTYDDVGRATEERFMSGGTERWKTTTINDGNVTTVVPPARGSSATPTQKTRSTVNAFGQTVSVDEFFSDTDFERTAYTYTPVGELATTTDSQGNVTAADFDWRGRRLSLSDPDQGRSSFAYDEVGNLTTSTDAAGRTTWMGYDELNRQREKREGGPAGTLLASWSYDAPGELGMIDYSSSFNGGNEYRTDVAGYDHAGRPTGKDIVVPSNARTGDLAGTYRYGYAYGTGPDAGLRATTYPEAAGLREETVSTQRTNLDLPATLAGSDGYPAGYVSATRYDPFGRMVERRSGNTGHEFVRGYSFEPDTGRVQNIRTIVGGTTQQDDTYHYDNVHLTGVEHGVENQRECFGYDGRARLTEAWTTSEPWCEAARLSTGGGPDAYSTAWRYNEIGNLLAVTEGKTTDNYTYPGAGEPRPHAVTGTAANNNGEFTAIDPARVVDTRSGVGECRAAGAPVTCARVPAGESITVQVAGYAGVPNGSVNAVSVNVTTTDSADSGFVTLHAAGTARPATSNLNSVPGQNVSNSAVVRLPTSGADKGRLTIYASAETEVVLDVSGYHVSANGTDGASFNPLDGQRVLDTRASSPAGSCWNGATQAWCARIPAGGTIAVAVAGQGDVPSSGVSAVAANITAINASGAGYVAAWADGDPAPGTSNVNYSGGQTVAGLSTVKLGDHGRILLSSPTAVDVIVDVQGWYTTPGDQSGASFTPHSASAKRLVDTRSDSRTGKCPTTTGKCVTIPAGGELVVKTVGAANVPVGRDVSAVAVNVTATNTTGTGGFLTLYADGHTRPATSNLNFGAGQTVSNAAIVRVGDNGNIRIYAERQTDVLVDVQGWYRASTREKTYAYDVTGSLCWEAEVNVAEPSCGAPPVSATTYEWDHLDRLAAVTSSSGTSEYIYDADGQRLLRVDPATEANGQKPTTTLYLDDTELTMTPDGVGATRYYSFGSSTVAMRKTEPGVSSDTLVWLGGTSQGSVSVANPNGTSIVDKKTYQPYGAPRSDAELGTDRGFLGQTEDDATGLVYLNARYYKASLGRFISVDAIADPSKPQTLNGYAYGLNNPVALSDPTGLSPLDHAPGALRAAYDLWVYATLSAFSKLGKLGPAPARGRGRTLHAQRTRQIIASKIPVAIAEIETKKAQYCASKGTLYDGQGNCGVMVRTGPGGILGGVQDSLGGALASNPFFQVAEVVAGLGGYELDLGAKGVNRDSWAYRISYAVGFVAFSAIPVGKAIQASRAAKGATAAEKALPALRQAYVDDVASIADESAAWLRAGADSEFVGREAWANRRAVGIFYKNKTPASFLERITARNLSEYGDPLGPSIGFLAGRGKSWVEIAESAARAGGKDLGF
jgi:RHS repeat-associated protein